MNIFPDFDEKIEEFSDKKIKGTKELLFDYKRKRVVIVDGKTIIATEVERVKQWIELLILTQTNKYIVYKDTGFGMTDLYNLQGHNILSTQYGIMELEREIKEKIQAKEEVKEVIDITSSLEFNTFKISITVILKSGETLTKEVSMNA